jgi:hypothetical protein
VLDAWRWKIRSNPYHRIFLCTSRKTAMQSQHVIGFGAGNLAQSANLRFPHQTSAGRSPVLIYRVIDAADSSRLVAAIFFKDR